MIRLRGLIAKEFIQFFRDPVMIILFLWLFTVEIIFCTYALQFEVKHVPLGVTDNDRTALSRVFISEFLSGESFVHAGAPGTMTEATSWLQSGRAQALLDVPIGFERDAQHGAARVQLILDGTNANTAIRARAYALEIVARFNRAYQRGGAPEKQLNQPSIRLWYNPELSNMVFMTLSMIGLGALMVGVFYPAASIVKEKEHGTIEQLTVTPLTTPEIFIAKTLPTLVIGLVALLPALLITLWFGAPLRGSLALFFALTAVFLLSATSIGVFIAAITRTLQQALLLSFFGLVPMLALSGTLVPVESMPDWLQALSLIVPLRHYLDVIVGVFLKGSGMRELWPHALALVTIASGMYAAAFGFFGRAWR